MKVLTVFLAIVVLLTLAACGDDFDAEAEKEAVMAVRDGIDDGRAIGDREATLAAFHEDLTIFGSYPDDYYSTALKDFGPDAFTEPSRSWWENDEVLVSTDLAVIKGERKDQDGTRGFGTAVFRKEDSQWKLIHYHTSYAGP